MSLAYLRDVYHKPFRPGAHVTVQSGFADPYHATIVGSIPGAIDDCVKVQDEQHRIRIVGVDDITFT